LTPPARVRPLQQLLRPSGERLVAVPGRRVARRRRRVLGERRAPACRAAYFANTLMACMQEHGYRRLVTYQADSRFWAFQGIESAIFLALSAGLVVLAYHRVLGRDA